MYQQFCDTKIGDFIVFDDIDAIYERVETINNMRDSCGVKGQRTLLLHKHQKEVFRPPLNALCREDCEKVVAVIERPEFLK